jgi:hypothetical protein
VYKLINGHVYCHDDSKKGWALVSSLSRELLSSCLNLRYAHSCVDPFFRSNRRGPTAAQSLRPWAAASHSRPPTIPRTTASPLNTLFNIYKTHPRTNPHRQTRMSRCARDQIGIRQLSGPRAPAAAYAPACLRNGAVCLRANPPQGRGGANPLRRGPNPSPTGDESATDGGRIRH